MLAPTMRSRLLKSKQSVLARHARWSAVIQGRCKWGAITTSPATASAVPARIGLHMTSIQFCGSKTSSSVKSNICPAASLTPRFRAFAKPLRGSTMFRTFIPRLTTASNFAPATSIVEVDTRISSCLNLGIKFNCCTDSKVLFKKGARLLVQMMIETSNYDPSIFKFF